MIGPGGVQPQDAGTVWRFETKDPDAWQVTLAPTFVSLSAKRFTRRSDLLARLTVVLHALEAWLIRALARFGVAGERRQGRVGIWTVDSVTGGEAKIAAIGVRVSRWVSWHGVALNVSPDLGHYAGIVPCGIRQHGVTSLAALGIEATMTDADDALRAAWDEVFEDGSPQPGCTVTP